MSPEKTKKIPGGRLQRGRPGIFLLNNPSIYTFRKVSSTVATHPPSLNNLICTLCQVGVRVQ